MTRVGTTQAAAKGRRRAMQQSDVSSSGASRSTANNSIKLDSPKQRTVIASLGAILIMVLVIPAKWLRTGHNPCCHEDAADLFLSGSAEPIDGPCMDMR